MVIRYGNYEMTEYLKQLKNKKLKRLVPQVMIVFYTGDKKWNTPLELNDYFDIPEELKEDIHNKMNRDNFIYATIITGSLDLIRDLPEGDEIDIGKKAKNEKRKLYYHY